MKYKLLLTLLTIGLLINAQNIAFKKKNFENQEAFKLAQKNLKEGNKKYISKSYSDALIYFLKANNFNPNNADLNFKIGISYLKSEKQEKSLNYFKKAKKLDPKIHPLLEFGLAQAYQYNKQYADAITTYNTFLNGLSVAEKGNYQAKVNEKIKECQAAGGENTVTELTTNKEQKKEKQDTIIKEKQKKQNVTINKTPEPFDPEKKEIYKPVNAHPVNTEIEKPIEKKAKPSTKPVIVVTEKNKIKPVKNNNNIFYKIQVLSSSRKLTLKEKKALYNGVEKLQEDRVNGTYKYLLGNFKTKQEALNFRKKINIIGSFIVKYKNGKRQ